MAADPRPGPRPAGPDPLDAVLAEMDGADADALLAELLGHGAAPEDPLTLKPGEIRSRVKALAASNPALLAKIITAWMNEARRRK